MFYVRLCRCCENCPSFHALFPGNFKSSHLNDGYTLWHKFYHDESGKCGFNSCAYINSLNLSIAQIQTVQIKKESLWHGAVFLPRKFARKFCVRFSLNQSWQKTRHWQSISAWRMSLTVTVLEERNDAQRGKFFRVHCISKLREARKLDGWSSVEPFRRSLKRPFKSMKYIDFFGKGHAIFGGILKQQFQGDYSFFGFWLQVASYFV